ncbi:MAG: hypothetical protein K2X82_07250 [Gemmataceae bacterium]|nr:hypothetical protein [Gemmataceae bacterium]
MTRPCGAVVALAFLVSPAPATLDRPKAVDRPAGLKVALGKRLPPDATEVPPPAEAELTAETEVVLDGRNCRYKDVPSTASVVRMVLAPDGKTITRVEFRTRK